MIFSREQILSFDLSPSEREAALFVCKIGIDRARELIDKITRRIDRRLDACWKANNHLPINREWIRQTPLEVELMHRLKIGICIVDQSNSPWAAHQRILARIAERNAKRLAKRNNALCISVAS
ncbi:hypothetical protein [Vibrio cholerae]|uniref:hypothetical protein n=1 Tax=Vibrio cholerae TaxID=666 RepID=UPI000E6A5CCA|nr:hypothetical protein [Vibrio cholerae]HAU9839283.1 hypothetical protein [Vibrio cholerae O1]MBY4642151.1 hypothetical protein [Vibrio cholerae]MCR9658423.1 hypothetical protein [Vibrio cholerae]MCR9689105.1 hypothetical protein [Vibrio cholerae]MCR9737612.1 hypothetical protein [Vibrio cholerae]